MGIILTKKATSLPKRNEIPEQFKWKLEDIYESNEAWEKDFAKAKLLASNLKDFKDKIGESSDSLLKCLEAQAEVSRLFEKVYVYAQMRSHEDSSNGYYQGLADRTDSLSVAISSASSFIVPEILSIQDDELSSFFKENEKLSFYNKYLGEIVRTKPHILNASEEQILAMSGEMANAPGSIYSMLNNADIKFPAIKDENGEEIELTKGRYIQLLESTDRRVRKDAFDALYTTYKKQRNTLAALLNSQVKSNIFNAKVRKYSSARESYLFPDNVPEEVYDNLIKAIHDNMHLMHRYVKLRKEMMGLDELHMYDIYTTMVKEVKMDITFEEAVDTVKKGVAVLGEKYSRDLEKGLTSGWIDVYENEGKRSGAYAWGCYDSHPYVLLNHTDNVNNMFTLAHEMGHALHSFYSDANQPYIYAQYKIFVAEVASTLNEALLMHYMLKNTTDKTKKMYLLNYYMEQFRTTVYRQTMFAEFEKMIHSKAEAGESLTADVLSQIYHDLNAEYYGSDMIIDELIDMEWSRIPHFYSSFYVYKYATGFSAATAIAHKIINEGQGAIDKYLEFLKSGGSDYPIELLKLAGVDMTTPDPINNALKVFEDLINQMEELAKQ
ncbi:MAG: oligoendopeptidase F [Clostridiales bacterium GWB2_37_7]|nr:MAG: oligoendopeptidase F [Clostridiales bacterium GWB2_37_7]